MAKKAQQIVDSMDCHSIPLSEERYLELIEKEKLLDALVAHGIKGHPIYKDAELLASTSENIDLDS